MMRRRTGIGTVLFISMLTVILILAVTVGYYGMIMAPRAFEEEDRMLAGEFLAMQKEILRAEVDRSVGFLRDPGRRFVFSRNDSLGQPRAPREERRSATERERDFRQRGETFLEQVSTRQVGEDGYMFVVNYDGLILAHAEYPDYAGRNAYELSPRDGARFHAEILQTARKGGGFAEYRATLPTGEPDRRRIAYVVGIPERRWIVGAVIDADAFDRKLADRRRAFGHIKTDHRRMLSIVFLSALGISLLVSILISRRVKMEFDRFARAFDRAVSSRETVDAGTLNLAEFTLLSHDANRIIEDFRRADEARAAGEKIYRAVVEDLPLLLCRFRADGTLTFVNDAYCRYFGFDREDLVGTSFFSLVPEESHEVVRRHYLSLTPDNPIRTYEHQVFDRNGETRWQRWTDRAVFEEDRLLEFQSIGEDITEHRRAEEALRASEEKFSSVFRLSPSIMILMDVRSRKILEVNESFARLSGYRPEEVIGSTLDNIPSWLDPEDRAEIKKTLTEKGRLTGYRIRFQHRNGAEMVGLLYSEIMDLGGRPVLVVTLSDITALEQAREDYRESERRLATLMDNLPGLAFRCRNDAWWTFEYASEGVSALTGYAPAELVGNRIVSYNDLIFPDDRDMVRELIHAALAERRPYVLEYRIHTRSGDIRWVWEKGTGVFEEDGSLRALEGFISDITERRRGEEALRESEHKYRTLIESMDNGFANHRIITDEDGNPVDYVYLEVNNAFERQTGQRREDVLGRAETDLMPGIKGEKFDWIGVYGRVALTGEPVRFEQYSDALGKWFAVSAYCPEPGYFVTNFHDVTPRVKAEESLRENEARLNFALDATSDGLWDWTIGEAEGYFSPSYYRMLGYEPGDFPPSPAEWEARIHPEDREPSLRANRDCIENRTPNFEIEFRMETRTGGWKWILGRGMAIARDENGVATRMIGTHVDITARKTAEADREHTLSLLRATLEATEDGILVENPERRMTVCNRRFIDLWNIPAEVIAGGEIMDMVDYVAGLFDNREEYIALQAGYHDDPEREGTEMLRLTDGRVYEYFTRPQRLGGAIVGRVWSFRDITRRVAAELALRESEHKYRTLFESMSDASVEQFVVFDEYGNPQDLLCVDMNPAFERLTGTSREQGAGKTLLDLVPEFREREPFDWIGSLGRVARTGTPERFDLYSPGMEKWLSASVYCPHPGYAVANLRDITESKRAEEELRFAWFSLERSRDSAVWVDSEGHMTRPNEASCRLMGYASDELESMHTYDVDENITPESWPAFWTRMVSGDISYYETVIIRKDGDRIPVELTFSHFWFENRDYIFASGRDITERKRAEEALRESEKLLSTVLDTLPVGVWILDKSARIMRGNPAGLRIWSGSLNNVPPERWVFNGLRLDTGEPLTEENWASRRAIFRGEEVLNEELEIECFDGSRKIMLNSAIPLRNERGEVTGGITVNEDITARKRAEEELREEKERLAVTLRSIGDGVITTDREGRVMLMNRVAEDLTGWLQEDAELHPLEEVFHIVDERTGERCENPFQKVIDTGGIVEMANHTRLISRDGREILLADSGAPILDHYSRIIGVVLVFRDITDSKRLEDELQKMEKLESVGVLAGGIAHDFNNILTGIIGALSLIRLILPPGHDSMEILDEAEHQALRARDLTAQLLTFSKGGAPIRIAASIVETVRETVSFVIRGSRVRALFTLPEDLWVAEVDLNQLSQVINNLTLNAVQAMPEGGRIEVAAENFTIDQPRVLPIPAGRYIRLTVRDTGTGIPREHLSRIFDPYYTTKKMGSGLGLATTYSIIKRHDGHIEVESEPGQGTTFRIYLPAANAPALEPEVKTEPAVPVIRGRVLIMDDDKHVRAMASMLLDALGYTSETVEEGARTIERYREARETGEPFDAVIMDLTIPDGMGGIETIEGLRALDPGVRAIVSSGYSTDPVMAEYRQYGFSGVLVKPYRLEEIARVLHDVIQAKKQS